MNDARSNTDLLNIDPAELPSIPAVAAELLASGQWDEVDMKKVGQLVLLDPVLGARILRAVNSAYYGFPRRITTITQALTLLGLRAARGLVLSFSVLEVVLAMQKGTFNYPRFWAACLTRAYTARELATVVEFDEPEEAFLGGLLQDIGVLVLARLYPQGYAKISSADDSEARMELAELEQQVLGVNHVDAGKLLLAAWNFPSSLCVPIFFHHDPAKAESSPPRIRTATWIQYIAGRLGDMLYRNGSDRPRLEEVASTAEENLGISRGALERILDRADVAVAENAHFFEVDARQVETYAALLQDANRMLGALATEQETLVRQLQAAREDAERLSEQLRLANNQLLEEVRLDPLTQLPNRRGLIEFLTRELKQCARVQEPLSLVFLELDEFKRVNDSCGHRQGDAALVHVSNVLRGAVRPSDIVARYGGVVFAIVLRHANEETVSRIAERVRTRIPEDAMGSARGEEAIHLTASIGIAEWHHKTAVSVETLIDRADKAMYIAKRDGKNCIRRWTS